VTMLTGYNNNVTYRDEVFHIQTEEGGINNPYITTLLYRGGAIHASKKTSYRDLLGKPGFQDELRRTMDRQHRTVIKALLAGRFDEILFGKDEAAPPPPAEEPEVPESPSADPAVSGEGGKNLDDILLDFIAGSLDEES